MSSQKKLIYFLPNFGVGGAGNSILKICENLKNNNEIIIISLGANYYKKRFKKINVKIIEL